MKFSNYSQMVCSLVLALLSSYSAAQTLVDKLDTSFWEIAFGDRIVGIGELASVNNDTQFLVAGRFNYVDEVARQGMALLDSDGTTNSQF